MRDALNMMKVLASYVSPDYSPRKKKCFLTIGLWVQVTLLLHAGQE